MEKDQPLADLKTAVGINDLAHRKTIREADVGDELTMERIQEIGEQATMWLSHLEWTHHYADTE